MGSPWGATILSEVNMKETVTTVLLSLALALLAYFMGVEYGRNSVQSSTDTVLVSVPAVPEYDTLWLPAKKQTPRESKVVDAPIVVNTPIDTITLEYVDSLRAVIYDLLYPVSTETPVVLTSDTAKVQVTFKAHIGYFPFDKKFRLSTHNIRVSFPYSSTIYSPPPDNRIWQKAVGIVGLGGMGYSLAKKSWAGASVSALLVGVGAFF